MSLWPDSTHSAWAVDSDSPLRIVAGWNEADTETMQLACWLGKSTPISVQVVASAPTTWKSPGTANERVFRKWLQEESETFAQKAHSLLKKHVERNQWAAQPARMMASTNECASLQQAAQDFGADLVLLGSRAGRPKGTFFISSAADTLLETAPRPLVVAPKNLRLSKKGVTRVNYLFLGRDGFHHDSGLQSAAGLAVRMGVPIRLIVMSPDTLSEADFDASIDSPNNTAEWYESSLGQLDHVRDTVIESVPAALPAAHSASTSPLVVEAEVAVGRGWKKAVHSVQWKKGDLACFAFRHQNQLKRVFSHSCTGAFLRHVPTPALIFPRSTA
ncbi:universal stress protein [Corynebacterium qintianiae]|uniref:Universal stress protein n=1 Tax=Corynebacterium qintianiae TaxID=2709392 RepID=A0A7T0PEH1_9CORY|nr:universal stress protein [Corynebacterium qintianiae]QPK83206.1 universal stress protein [Corynebacterium qintianiae]